MDPSQGASVNYSKVDFSQPKYEQPTYTFPYDALAAAVAAVAFAALHLLFPPVGTISAFIHLASIPIAVISVPISYSFYQQNRGKAEYQFAETFLTNLLEKVENVHKGIFWMKKAALRQYPEASIKLGFYELQERVRGLDGETNEEKKIARLAHFFENFLLTASESDLRAYLERYLPKLRKVYQVNSSSFAPMVDFAKQEPYSFPLIHEYLLSIIKEANP